MGRSKKMEKVDLTGSSGGGSKGAKPRTNFRGAELQK